MVDKITTRTKDHGIYEADPILVSNFAMHFYGSMDGTFRNLINFLRFSVGFETFEYWRNLTTMDAIIILCSEDAGRRGWDEYIRFIDSNTYSERIVK